MGRRLMIVALAMRTQIVALFACLLAAAACDGEEPRAEGATTETTFAATVTGGDDGSGTPASTTSVATETTTMEETPDVGPELVFNGDFEVGDQIPTGWELRAESAGQSVEHVAEGGDHHIAFSSPVDDGVPWPQARSTEDFEVTPHTEYLLSLDVRSPGEGRLFAALGFRDSNGNDILIRGPGEPAIEVPEWKLIESRIESPDDAASAYVILRLAIRPEVLGSEVLEVDVRRVSVREVLG